VAAPTSALNELQALARVNLTKWLVERVRGEDAVAVSDHIDVSFLYRAGRDVEIEAAIVRAQALQLVGRREEARDVALAAWDSHGFDDTVPDSAQTALCAEMAAIFGGLHGSEAVVQLLEPRLALVEQAFGPTDVRYLGFAEQLANHLAQLGRAAEAVLLLEQCLETRRAQPDEEATGWCETLLRNAAEALGDNPRALEIATRQLALHEEAHGPTYWAAVFDLRTIARLTQAADPTAALATFQQVLQRQQRALGPHAPAVLFDRLDLARALDVAGQPDRSLEMWEQALPVVAEQQADNPTLHLRVRFNIARLSISVGDTRRAMALYEEIAAEDETTDLESYKLQVAAVTNLALAYCNAGRAEDALRAANRAAAMTAARLPRTDPARQESERLADQIIAAGGQPAAAANAAPVAPDA
jgi:tetratricopeptide (TPR) repeat protein